MKLLIVLVAFIFIFVISTMIGLFEAPDSIHYMILGQYLHTGFVSPVYPFNTTRPSTLFGPLYGLIMTPILSLPWPWGITLVPILQCILVFLSAVFLYKIFRLYFTQKIAVAGSVLFLLLPFQWVFATYLMSETLAQFFVAVYAYTLTRLNKRWWATSDTLVCVAALLTLTRYVFVILFVVSIGYWLLSMQRKKFSWSSQRFFALTGISMICMWILFNAKMYGTLQLTSHTGRHVYNNVVVLGKLLPDPKNTHAQDFFSRIPPDFTFRPWWENQIFFQDLNEVTVDRWYLTVSIAAIRAHPFLWLGTIAQAAAKTPLHSPYQLAPYRSAQIHQLLNSCDASARMVWNDNIKTPFFHACQVGYVWSFLIDAQSRFYPYGAFLLLLLAITGIVAGLQSPGAKRLLAAFFLLMHLTQSTAEWVEGRFLIPLYPLYAFFIVYGVTTISAPYRRRPETQEKNEVKSGAYAEPPDA